MGALYLLTVADPHLVARLSHGSWHDCGSTCGELCGLNVRWLL
jgi:hypothetical protein